MLVFSEVLLYIKKKKADFLQGGEVHNLSEVMRCSKGDKFIRKFPPGTDVHCESIVYHYGEDVMYAADPTEVSFFEKKKKEDINFLGIKAKCISTNIFDETITEELLATKQKKSKKR